MTATASRLRDQSARASSRLVEGGKELFLSLRELTEAIEEEWDGMRQELELSGLPRDELADRATMVVHAVAGAKESVRLLRSWPAVSKEALWRPEGVEDLAAVLERIGQQATSLLARAQAPLPEFDPERTRIGLEQAASSEGEDVADIVARLKAGGTP